MGEMTKELCGAYREGCQGKILSEIQGLRNEIQDLKREVRGIKMNDIPHLQAQRREALSRRDKIMVAAIGAGGFVLVAIIQGIFAALF